MTDDFDAGREAESRLRSAKDAARKAKFRKRAKLRDRETSPRRAVKAVDRAAKEALDRDKRYLAAASVPTQPSCLPPLPIPPRPLVVSWSDGRGDGGGDAAIVRPWEPSSDDASGLEVSIGAPSIDELLLALRIGMSSLRLLPSERPRGAGSRMPSPVRDAAESYGWSDTGDTGDGPSEADRRAADLVIDMAAALRDPARFPPGWPEGDEGAARARAECLALTGVSAGVPLRRIARTLGVSAPTVTAIARRAVERLAALLADGQRR